MEEYQDDLCDFCGTECYCFTKKDVEEISKKIKRGMAKKFYAYNHNRQ